MRAGTLVATAAMAVMALSGCSGGDTSVPAATQPAAETTSSAPAETPTPQTSTPEQLASIIAGQESDWRETIDGSGECRILWVLESDDPVDQANAYSCYLREQTIVMSASNAGRDLRALTPPAEMSSLYNSTLGQLDAISAVDLTGACGQDSSPAKSDGCNASLGELYAHYNLLEDVLDQWKPYM
ncbi:hypothetical protein [Puerhibacterium puerhi]|uniref:hypothetical protein n=1 Tax=Puerhibacterium puerhi TaxID=2692623 RepID=UPI00135BE30F|nr:hypothetical protein [Puerhibacterium puerhi]